VLCCEETFLTVLPRLPKRLRILECSSEKLVLPIEVGETIDSYRARWNAWWDEKEERERAEARCEALKEELVAAAWAPARVERWLAAGGFEILEAM
jgi:hypothetical protein